MSRAPAMTSPRHAVLALLLIALPALAAAETTTCRAVSATSPAPARDGRFNHGLLWRIESDGHAPSYLFGTMHTSDPRITTLPCPVEQAFDRSTSYTMEMITNGTGIVTMAEAMFFSDGRKLKDVLGDKLYRDTLRVAGIDEGPHGPSVNNMKPWAVMMTLLGPREARGLFLDLALQLRATLQNKPTHGLETMHEQITVFNGMNIEDQVALLRDAVQNADMAKNAMEELVQSYLRRDLHALMAMQEKYRPADAQVHDKMMQRLLTQRNHNMAERMRPRLAEGNAFIAVGALHLPGEFGLLQLLSAAGYRVTAVY